MKKKTRYIIILIIPIIFSALIFAKHMMIRKIIFKVGLQGGNSLYEQIYFLHLLGYPFFATVLLIALITQIVPMCKLPPPKYVSYLKLVISAFLLVILISGFVIEYQTEAPIDQYLFDGFLVRVDREIDVQEIRDWFESTESNKLKEFLEKFGEKQITDIKDSNIILNEDELPNWIKKLSVKPYEVNGDADRICFAWHDLLISYGIEVTAKGKEMRDRRYTKRLGDGIYATIFR